MKTAIRVDVNSTIATGHIKRDIAVALCLRQLGQECIFISADDNCLPYLRPFHFETIILNSYWNEMENELPKMKEIICNRHIDSLLVDSYQVTSAYMQALIPLTYVTYFDELGLYGYGCQQIINGVLEPPDYSDAVGKALLGPNYVALRQEFMNLGPKEIYPEIGSILVTSGGTDLYHFCVSFLEAILNRPQWKKVKIIVALGEFSADRDYLMQKYGQDERVKIVVNCEYMAQLMQEVDYAVTAGGTTLYELCAAGVCSSSYAIAENQLEVTQSFHRQGLVPFAGDFRSDPKGTMERIMEQMQAAKAADVRLQRSQRLQSLVDGKGAMRIAVALTQVQKET